MRQKQVAFRYAKASFNNDNVYHWKKISVGRKARILSCFEDLNTNQSTSLTSFNYGSK